VYLTALVISIAYLKVASLNMLKETMMSIIGNRILTIGAAVALLLIVIVIDASFNSAVDCVPSTQSTAQALIDADKAAETTEKAAISARKAADSARIAAAAAAHASKDAEQSARDASNNFVRRPIGSDHDPTVPKK